MLISLFMRTLLDQELGWLSRNQTEVGSILIGISALGLVIATFIKTKADKIPESNKKRQAERKKLYASWILAVLVCATGTYYGNFLTRRVAEQASRNALRIQEETDSRVDRMQREFRERFQQVLVNLNAAKHEESKAITEEKIRTIKSDLVQWAQDFVADLPTSKSTFAQQESELQKRQTEEANKLAETQKKRSGQCFPAFSFATRLLQESVRAYATRAGKTNIIVESTDLPENFYGQQKPSSIRFGTNGSCVISVASGWTSATQFAVDYAPDQPYLRITFTDHANMQTGQFHIQVNTTATKMKFLYTTNLPVPEPATINGEHDLSDYESPIRDVLQRIIKAQLLQFEG